MEKLACSAVTHAHLYPVSHPRLGAQIHGRAAVKYLRFMRRVRVDRLVLPWHVYGRWTPQVPVHPAHVVVAALDRAANAWQVVKDAELEPNPRVAGKGLSQEMTDSEMDAHFRRVLDEEPARIIELGGIETDCLRVWCDREHPVWPSHGETNGCVFQVPYGILNPLEAHGSPGASPIPNPAHIPLLRQGRISPEPPAGMTCRRRGEAVIFEGPRLSVGFSLRRPVFLHLGWDAIGEGQADCNRLATRRVSFADANRGMSGPLIVTPWGDYGAHRWTGEIEIDGNRVAYRGLRSEPPVTIDATVLVEPDRLVIELRQRAEADVPVLEAEAWRLVWGLGRGMTGVAASPTLRPGRVGDASLPAMFAGDGVGCLACGVWDDAPGPAALQVESFRPTREVAAGVVLAPRPPPGECMAIPAGEARAVVELAVSNLQPVRRQGPGVPGPGLRRHWASTFACYRPEWGGFSNHAASVNCHVNQCAPVEVAAFTATTECGFRPLDAARFTIGRALMDGGGYGYWRNLYLDSDPVLVSAAGRIFQADPDPRWLKSVEPGLAEAVDRILGTLGEHGLAVCRDLSGNSSSHRWSCNACDVVGFGHMDAYVNAWTYRALRNATALLAAAGRRDLSARARAAANRLSTAFETWLFNPQTGWVISWRSRDGEIHDYAHLWINGPACAFGVLRPDAARRALRNLEDLRARQGLSSARAGLPFNLLPLRPEDHMLPCMPAWGYHWNEPTFETYTDGALSPAVATYYLRALSIHGFTNEARAMASDLDAGFADGLFTGGGGGGLGQGNEFLSWEGLSTGYEGTFGPNMGVLYAVAIEQGLFQPPDPEWWPEGG